MPSKLVGWQPSRFLIDQAEAERAFQFAERLGSVNAAAQELGTTWPSLPGNEAGVDCRDVDMTEDSRRPTLPMTDDRAPTDNEVEAFERDALLEDPGSISAEHYPRLFNVSASFWYTRVLRAQVPDPPEYVTVHLPHLSRAELTVAIAKWNMLWEAAQFRRRLFSADELPPELSKVADHGDVNGQRAASDP